MFPGDRPSVLLGIRTEVFSLRPDRWVEVADRVDLSGLGVIPSSFGVPTLISSRIVQLSERLVVGASIPKALNLADGGLTAVWSGEQAVASSEGDGRVLLRVEQARLRVSKAGRPGSAY